MRELIACLIIATLTFASSAVSSRVYQISGEDETYIRKTCLSDHDSKCEIEEKDKFKGNLISSCELKAELYGNASLSSYSNKIVIMSLPDVSGNKIAAVNLANCNIKEIALGVDLESVKEVFPHDDKYYVIYRDDACKQYYCKMILDKDGKTVQAASPLTGVNTSSDIQIKLGSKGFLLNEFRRDGEIKLYFVPYDDLNVLRDLYTVPHGNWFALSTLENKLGFCAFDDGKTVANSGKKIVCQQYDAEGKEKLLETAVPISPENHVDKLVVSNALGHLAFAVDEFVGPLNKYNYFAALYKVDDALLYKSLGDIKNTDCGNGNTLELSARNTPLLQFDFVYFCYDPYSNVDNKYSSHCILNCPID